MPNYTIFVEGKADKKFIQDILLKMFNNKDMAEIIPICSNSIYAQIPNIKKHIDSGRSIIVIFDADNNPQIIKDNIKKTESEIKSKIKYFLFPDNKSNGALEDLLLLCINASHKKIIDCFDKYKLCIQNADNRYSLPGKKAMVYAYCEALSIDGSDIKEIDRNYLNQNIWDLDSPSLNDLYRFLNSAIKI